MGTLKEFLRKKVLGLIGLARDADTQEDERMTFINDSEMIKKSKIHEYNIWYEGDDDELLNFYTYHNTIEYNLEPYYMRNKKNYFWSVSSTENDIKRTHSGQPRNIVDTLVNITKFPLVECGKISDELDDLNETLDKIIEESNLEDIFKDEQMPLTLVEGWGCYKINWDKDYSDYPYLVYYRAENVDFIKKCGKVIGIIFKDYYTDGANRKYLLVETRRIKFDKEKGDRALVIEKQLFRTDKSGDYVTEESFSAVPELSDVEPYIEIGPLDMLLAVPCIFFGNSSKTGGPGRSIFTGKIGLFDDLDQCLSQDSNSIRKSTPTEYFNSDFLERNPETGIPVQPKAYDRKYVMYKGQQNGDGSSNSSEPVTVTQPNIDFSRYSQEAVQILLQIINGTMSPATLGIDIAKKDNAEAQREKEKVTIFTRNAIIERETRILKKLLSQMLCAYEFMKTGEITVKKYDISVKFSEFADDSYENKLEKLGAAYDSETISDEMYMTKLYGDSLSKSEYQRELDWLKEHHTKPKDEGMQGIAGGGNNLPGMFGLDEEGEDSGEEEL